MNLPPPLKIPAGAHAYSGFDLCQPGCISVVNFKDGKVQKFREIYIVQTLK